MLGQIRHSILALFHPLEEDPYILVEPELPRADSILFNISSLKERKHSVILVPFCEKCSNSKGGYVGNPRTKESTRACFKSRFHILL